MTVTEGAGRDRVRDIERRLMRFVREELLAPGTALDRDADLLSSGLLDSVAVLRLATFVAEEFAFEIRPADFVIENFRTVAVLARYVERVTGAAH